MAHPQQTTMPTAPESPALGVTVSGNVQKYAIKKKKILNSEESELFELTQAAGIAMDQEVFKIIVDLLKMNVAPLAVFQTLKAMCAGQRIADTSASDISTASQTATAPTEPRVRGKVEKGGRDGSGQRVPRQPSASRGQKSGEEFRKQQLVVAARLQLRP
ncbi:hypothetical protein SKAU_G00359930 [Synaphobranchus kaupii]|uniref:Mitotic-spindle organizing protein 2 n=1 Tax=Synaphobranchus kaupii TaxID=118154 RepID=A0A9Q1EI43_SYNKA|nr:hypothetical protein SKAU_G00359930 [Synaphobranchus kaupii]